MDSNSEFIKKHGNAISKMYLKESKSTYEIAQEFNTYPNKIRRTLKTLGVSLRDKSKAQTVAIKNGRHEHPTRGKKRSESEKIAISNGMSKFWNDMEEEERARRCEISRKQWASMSDEQRELLRKSATEAVLKASKEGSKIEKYIYKGLTAEGYEVIFHKKNLVSDRKLEVDLFLPTLNLAIEIDGPAHFLPIWGEEKLQKHINADARKAGLLLQSGFVLIRLKNITKNVSKANMAKSLDAVVEEVKKVENKFPPKSKRLIEIEV